MQPLIKRKIISSLPYIIIFTSLICLIVPPRDRFGSTITYIGIDKLGDDAIAILLVIGLMLYAALKKSNQLQPLTQFAVILFLATRTLFYFVNDQESLNPVYVFGLFLVQILLIINTARFFLNRSFFTKYSNKRIQSLGITGLILTLILLIAWALPFEKSTLEMIGGGTWASSGESTYITECCTFAEINTVNAVSDLVMYSFLIILFILQLIGFSIPTVSYLVAMLPAIFQILNMLSRLGTSPFDASRGTSWTKELIEKYKPTETITGTVGFYIFTFVTLLILINILITFVLKENKK